MHTKDLSRWQLDHASHHVDRSGERRTLVVVALTAVAMVVEIVAGLVLGSMALLADGWHMGTHAAALGLAAFTYAYARRHSGDERFSFGTGKVNALGGFASAVALGVVAIVMALESIGRLITPGTIHYNEAILIAIAGLAVNLACAGILAGGDHRHAEQDGEHAHGHDHNLRAAFLHVLADALTSVLAIAALVSGKFLGWDWLDPVIGMAGGIVIAHWSVGLLRAASRVLLDRDVDPAVGATIRAAIETGSADRVADLHVWRIGTNYVAAIVSIVTHRPHPPDHYKRLIAARTRLRHLTVEVNPCTGGHDGTGTGVRDGTDQP